MRQFGRGLVLMVSLLLVLSCSIASFAQGGSAVLSGRITDPNGLAVVGAKVQAVNVDTTATYSTETNEVGLYNLPNLVPGTYRIMVEKEGFARLVKPGLELHVADSVAINFTLQVGSVAQSVTVSGEAPVIDTTTSSLGNLVSDQTISELPLNGRNYTDLTLLAPGVVAATHSGTGDAGTWFSSNGAPPRSNNYMLDGALIVTFNGTTPAGMTGNSLGVDGIKEYKLVTSMFSAEYGLSMGSQMVMVSKGGANKWSGSVFEYLRNNHLDARNFFEAQPSLANNILVDASRNLMRLPQFKRNNFGGSFGGPIQKDKTFFFLTYEGVRLAQGDTIQNATLAAACHFVQPVNASNNPVGGPIIIGGGPIPSGITPPAGATQKILQGPISTVVPGATGANLVQAGCGTAPVGTRVAALVQPWIGQFPFPNETIPGSTLNFTFPGFTRARDDYAQLRVDHNFSTNDSFFSRYTISDGVVRTPYSGGTFSSVDTGSGYPQLPVSGRSRNQYITLGENHIISPTLMNTFRLSFTRGFEAFSYNEANTPLNPDFLLRDAPGSPCFSGGTCIWSFVPGNLTGGFVPAAAVTGIAPCGVCPSYHANNFWTITEDVFYTKGKHAFKFGTLINRMNQPLLQSKFVNAGITFASIFTPASGGIPATGFLTGIPSSYTLALPGQSVALNPGSIGPTSTLLAPPYNGNFLDRDFTFYTFGFYVQDDYRVSSRLTLNLGLRYEFRTDLHEMFNRNSAVPDIHTSSSAVVPKTGLFTNPTYKNFSPRIGFAWDVFGNGKTALKSGFGIYFDVGNYGALLTQSASGGIPPFIATTTFQNTGNLPVTIPLNPAAGTAGKSLQGSDYIAESPHSLEYNLTVEQQLPFGVGLSVSYVGRRGLNLYTGMEGNPVRPDHFDSAGRPVYNVANGQIGCQNNALPVDSNGNPLPFTLTVAGVPTVISPGQVVTIGSNTGAPYPCRINPFWASDILFTNAASSWYNGLQTAVTKRLARGLTFQGAYTWSRSTDTTQGARYNDDCGGNPASALGRNPYNIANDYAISCYDVTNSMRFNLVYHLPNLMSEGFLSKVTNGWWMGNIVSVQGGNAFTPIIGQDRSFSGIASQSNIMYASINTTAISTANGNFIPFDPNTVITGNPQQWFNPFMFGQAPLGQVANLPRNYLRGPGLGTWDFSLVKDTKLGFLGEAGNLQFRAEFFNLLNRANFGFVNAGASVFAGSTTLNTYTPTSGPNAGVVQTCTIPSCPIQAPVATAGQINTTTTTARQIQLALRLSF